MKKTLLLTFLLLSSVCFADGPIELLKEKMSILLEDGALTFDVIRTSKTPQKIKVGVNFRQADSVCTNYDYEEVWIPPTTRQVCDPDSEDCYYRNGRRICERVRGRCYSEHVPGYYDTQRYCVNYEDVYKDTTKKIDFSFKKANTLTAEQKEIFEVTIKQKNRYSRSLEMSGKVIEADTEYKIYKKSKLFGENQLRFDKI